MPPLDTISDHLHHLLSATDARPVELDDAFALQGDFGGQSVHLEPQAFRGGGLDWARIARLKGGPRVQVVNAVFLPSIERGGPIFAMELLLFGDAVHLFVIDLVGARGEALDAQRRARQSLAANHDLEPVPPWGGPAFSDHLIFFRPGKRANFSARQLVPVITELSDAWLHDFQRPGGHGDYRALRTAFIEIQRQHEPARPFLTRLSDEETVEHLLHHYLYPVELTRPVQPAKDQGGKGPR